MVVPRPQPFAVALLAVLSSSLLSSGLARSASAAEAAGVWTSAGSMSQYRNSASAVALPEGRALVTGGYPSVRTTERFSVSTGTWSAAGSLLVGRMQHASVALADGRILVTGGVGRDASDNPIDLSSSELYDPATDTFSAAPAMRHARRGHTMLLLPGGSVLAIGSAQSNLVPPEIFDPAAGAWTDVPSSSGRTRSYPAVVLLRDGRVLAVSGDYISATSAPNGTAEVLDPKTRQWTLVGSLNDQRFEGYTTTLLRDGRVLVAGGNVYQRALVDTAELFDPATGTWTRTGSMSTVRASHVAGLLPDGRVLVAGGSDASKRLASAEAYDPATQTWTAAAPMDTVRNGDDVRAVSLTDGSLLLAGAFGSGASQRFVPAAAASSPAPAPPASSSSPSPTPTASASASASPSPSPTAAAHVVPSLQINPYVVRFGQPAYVTISGSPGATVDLYLRKYLGEFTKIRDGLVLDGNGQAVVATRPDMNLRFQARDRTVEQGSSLAGADGLMTVEKNISINVVRVSALRYTFSGSINPAHPGATVSLFRNGSLLRSGIPVNSSRVYSVTTNFAPGTFSFEVRTGANAYNNASVSPTRSLRIA